MRLPLLLLLLFLLLRQRCVWQPRCANGSSTSSIRDCDCVTERHTLSACGALC